MPSTQHFNRLDRCLQSGVCCGRLPRCLVAVWCIFRCAMKFSNLALVLTSLVASRSLSFCCCTSSRILILTASTLSHAVFVVCIVTTHEMQPYHTAASDFCSCPLFRSLSLSLCLSLRSYARGFGETPQRDAVHVIELFAGFSTSKYSYSCIHNIACVGCTEDRGFWQKAAKWRISGSRRPMCLV